MLITHCMMLFTLQSLCIGHSLSISVDHQIVKGLVGRFGSFVKKIKCRHRHLRPIKMYSTCLRPRTTGKLEPMKLAQNSVTGYCRKHSSALAYYVGFNVIQTTYMNKPLI